jgi:16S rRNA (cytosine1402-N4)-methyltransferase
MPRPRMEDRNDVHVPVLREEVVRLLAPRAGGRYLDGTVGAGGHARALLDASGPDGRLLGLDADEQILAIARQRLGPFVDRVRLEHANFRELADIARESGFVPLDGVLLDLGVSSLQLDTAERGFSIQTDAPLDMRLDRSRGPTAADLVADLDERELADVVFRYGEEPRSRAVARAVVAARRREPIRTTRQLAAVVERVVPRGRINGATRTFQALRIAVNDELEALRVGLRRAHEVLQDGGRLAVISFHSLEDRIVKQYFVGQANPCICPPRTPVCICGRQPTVELVTRKPVTAGSDELAANPRARSAKLRVAARLGPPLD